MHNAKLAIKLLYTAIFTWGKNVVKILRQKDEQPTGRRAAASSDWASSVCSSIGLRREVISWRRIRNGHREKVVKTNIILSELILCNTLALAPTTQQSERVIVEKAVSKLIRVGGRNTRRKYPFDIGF